MRTADFDYNLPSERIAQYPLPRGESRLLVLHRGSGEIEHRCFADLSSYLGPDDMLVLNETRVVARRTRAILPSGREAEALLLREAGARGWEALLKPGRRVREGDRLEFELRNGQRLVAEAGKPTPEGGRVIEFADEVARERMRNEGEAPLPPYIRETLREEARYQTVYAREGGSAAAPTAGLHFTEAALEALRSKGVRTTSLWLHVGVDTFRPVRAENAESHVMHGEEYSIPEETAEAVAQTRGKVLAVGTTTVRALESAAVKRMRVRPGFGKTSLFILPGFDFKVVGALLTNFHQPKSTLLMLLAAFAGREQVLAAYREALAAEYRFLSFGDAMLVL